MPDPPAAIDAREVAPTIVLVHGLLETADVWRDMQPALTEHHRFAAVSLPGASPGAGNAIGMTVDDLAEAVYHHLLAQDVKHCVLVRHSVGEAVVLRLIAAHPDFAATALEQHELPASVDRDQPAFRAKRDHPGRGHQLRLAAGLVRIARRPAGRR
jgi:pimeloyl-ACP methyl ester carboxylesterase